MTPLVAWDSTCLDSKYRLPRGWQVDLRHQSARLAVVAHSGEW